MDAARIAATIGLPTAAPRARVSVEGRPALVYPEITGRSLAVTIRKQPLSAARLLGEMATLHHAVHRHAITGLRTVRSVLLTDIDYGPAPAPLKRAAASYLQDLPDADRLLHGDFHIDNIVVRDQALIILDWAKAAMGDPAADVVRSEMLMRFGEGPADPITTLWRDWAAQRLIKAYRHQGALSAERLSAWRPIVALAWLRARPAVRNRAFHAYLNRALSAAGLPAFTP
ncbi:MAG TPA: phosphotransferase, partial [Sphingobium sp.]|nr:phosphotransferase [Sphingobium sp.]